MKPREKIQREHEKFVRDLFFKWYNKRNSTQFDFDCSPEPPDAIAIDGENRIWIELADAYRSPDEARSERTAVMSSESHIKHTGLIIDPDIMMAIAICELIQAKISKTSYRETFEQYGKGFLVITERDPLFTSSTISTIFQKLKNVSYENDQKFFSHVFLGFRINGGLEFIQLPYSLSS